MSIFKKIVEVQSELKAPKGQYNSFGKYNYRSCEDIVEAVKPILHKHGLVLNIQDDLVLVGDRFYIKAIARIYDSESEGYVESVAFAREPLEKKGMDESQITGTASSYARKYALNGLLAIDDTKDADTDEYSEQTKPEAKPKAEPKPQPKTQPKAVPKAEPKLEPIPEPTETIVVGQLTNERKILDALSLAHQKGKRIEMKHVPMWLNKKYGLPEDIDLNTLDPKIVSELCKALIA